MVTDALKESLERAWLSENGARIPLDGSLNIGRSSKCQHVINDPKISREHTLLQYDVQGRNWLIVDLGSTNGTYLNGQKIIRPVPLKSGDEIQVGDTVFIFHEPGADAGQDVEHPVTDQTEFAIANSPVWLLIADVKRSTQLLQQDSQPELSSRLRHWAQECEAIVQTSGGLVNEYMGDGLLAFWRDTPDMSERIVRMLRSFYELRSESGLDYRVICHYGVVGFGGGMSSGLEKLAGKELSYIFKIEKPAGRTGRKVNLTHSAAKRLGPFDQLEELGEFSVEGFPGTHKLYAPVY